jgi:hypothetical protein
MHRRIRKTTVIASSILVSLLLAEAAIGGISVARLEQARANFYEGRFQTTLQILSPYDRQPPRRLSLDFMLAVSKCRTGNSADGFRRLNRLGVDYSLASWKAEDVAAQIADCGKSELPIAKLEGKYDNTINARAALRYGATPEKPQMSGLEYGWSYNQGDLYSTRANTALQCANVCLRDQRCKAMTWVGDQKLCWIKNTITGNRGQSGDMVSAIKLFD